MEFKKFLGSIGSKKTQFQERDLKCDLKRCD